MTLSKHPLPGEADQELLSAYLDNQLTVAERITLERRLQQEPTLTTELQELRAVKSMLGDLPPLAPPRSFTLDPATVGRPRALPLFNIFRLSSALATLLLALTVTLDLFGGPQPFGEPQPAEQPELSQAAQATGAPDALRQDPAAPAEAEEKAPAGEDVPSVAGGTAPLAGNGEATPDAASESAPAAGAPAPLPITGGGAAAGQDNRPPSAFVPPPLTTPATSSQDTVQTGQPGVTTDQPTPLSPLRWAQIGLASVALACGLGAVLAWQQGR